MEEIEDMPPPADVIQLTSAHRGESERERGREGEREGRKKISLAVIKRGKYLKRVREREEGIEGMMTVSLHDRRSREFVITEMGKPTDTSLFSNHPTRSLSLFAFHFLSLSAALSLSPPLSFLSYPFLLSLALIPLSPTLSISLTQGGTPQRQRRRWRSGSHGFDMSSLHSPTYPTPHQICMMTLLCWRHRDEGLFPCLEMTPHSERLVFVKNFFFEIKEINQAIM